MPRPSKEARLYVRKRKGREPVYVILDGSREIGTGCPASDAEGARKALARYLESTFRPDTGQRDLSAIACAEILIFYYQGLPANSPSRKTIGYHIRNLNAFWGDKMLADVRGSTCRDYVAARPVKASTARQELKTFQAAINFWHQESPLAAVPQVALPKASPPRDRVLERSEAARLLKAARTRGQRHVARFILIGLYTGTRHDAILKLRWDRSAVGGHVDFPRGILYRIGGAEQRTTKARPPVRIPPRLLGHLRRWRKIDEATGALHVVSYKGADVAKMKRAFRSVVQAAGLGWEVEGPDGRKIWKTDVTPHTLRHTCASWRLWNGETIWEVAGILGADASTVDRVYGHHQVDREKRRA